MYEITYHCLFEPLHGASKWAELDTNMRVLGRRALGQGCLRMQAWDVTTSHK